MGMDFRGSLMKDRRGRRPSGVASRTSRTRRWTIRAAATPRRDWMKKSGRNESTAPRPKYGAKIVVGAAAARDPEA